MFKQLCSGGIAIVAEPANSNKSSTARNPSGLMPCGRTSAIVGDVRKCRCRRDATPHLRRQNSITASQCEKQSETTGLLKHTTPTCRSSEAKRPSRGPRARTTRWPAAQAGCAPWRRRTPTSPRAPAAPHRKTQAPAAAPVSTSVAAGLAGSSHATCHTVCSDGKQHRHTSWEQQDDVGLLQHKPTVGPPRGL